MQTRFGSLVLHYKKIPPVFYLSLGALIALLLSLLLVVAREQQKTEAVIESYAGALAELSASNLASAAMNNDLVSMHALLQELLSMPRVKFCAVYDVENRLLAQAGELQEAYGLNLFDAQIPLHDQLYGRVSVAIDGRFEGDAMLSYALSAVVIILLLSLAFSLYESYGRAWQLKPPTKVSPCSGDDEETPGADNQIFETSEATKVLPEDGFDEEAIEGTAIEARSLDELEPVEEGKTSGEESESNAVEHEVEFERVQARQGPIYGECDLILALTNLRDLRAQLSGRILVALLQRIEQRMARVLGLYGGTLLKHDGEHGFYCMRFSSDEGVDLAAFNACCAAQVIKDLCAQEKLKLSMQALVCSPEADVKMSLSSSGIVLQGFVQSELLAARLQLEQDNDGGLFVSTFKAPYADLISRQSAHLKDSATV